MYAHVHIGILEIVAHIDQEESSRLGLWACLDLGSMEEGSYELSWLPSSLPVLEPRSHKQRRPGPDDDIFFNIDTSGTLCVGTWTLASVTRSLKR